jgi:hypothetical protein
MYGLRQLQSVVGVLSNREGVPACLGHVSIGISA